MNNRNQVGCCHFIFWLFGIIAFITLFFHPVLSIAIVVVGLVFFCMIARLEFGAGWMDNYDRPAKPAQIVYRREVTVSETIYAAPSYRPRTREFLEDVFKPIE